MMVFRKTGILLLLIQLLTAETFTLNYQEKTGETLEQSRVLITLQKESMKSRFTNRELTIQGNYITGEGTQFSQQINVERNDTVNLSRAGNSIIISNSQSLDTLEIDNHEWIGDLSNLKDFVCSGEMSKTFWIVSSNFSEMDDISEGFTALKFKITLKERDTIEVRGELKEITHYQLRMADWRSILWKAEYWFNDEGIHIRSEQKRGGPFTKKTYTTLTSIEEN